MKHSYTIFTSIAVILFASASFAMAGTKAPTHPDTAEINIDLSLPGTVHVVTVQKWDGGNARDMRQSLDAYFGMANGDLSQTEAEQIQMASVRDIRNGSLPFFSFDGLSAALTDTNVTLENAVGPVESIGTLSIRHDMTATIAPLTDREVKIVANVPWNGTIVVTAPPGWEVVKEKATGASDRAEVEVAAGHDASMIIRPVPVVAPTPVPEANNTAPEVPAENTEAPQPAQPVQRVPGPTIALVTLSVLALAWVWQSRTTGRR